jgi:hypothetical protein
MMQWLSQVERTPLEDGDASFHPLALRWLRAVENVEYATGVDQWPLVAKLFSFLEANAEAYWDVPDFELARDAPAREEAGKAADADKWSDDEDDGDGLFSAAYEGMIYHDSTDDGVDASLFEDRSGGGTDFELEEEAQRLGRRLAFLATVAK